VWLWIRDAYVAREDTQGTMLMMLSALGFSTTGFVGEFETDEIGVRVSN
jgi:hypothetical protein